VLWGAPATSAAVIPPSYQVDVSGNVRRRILGAEWRHTRLVTFLPDDLYAQIERSMPIACVDFVLVRASHATEEIGLILRESPFGRVWCHLGGRIQRGETIAQALRRHARDSLDVELDLPLDPQPVYVYQWFPPDIAPSDGAPHGNDPRKHAIGLSFVIEHDGAVRPRGEALDFAYFAQDDLPTPIWPGCERLIEHLYAA